MVSVVRDDHDITGFSIQPSVEHLIRANIGTYPLKMSTVNIDFHTWNDWNFMNVFSEFLTLQNYLIFDDEKS